MRAHTQSIITTYTHRVENALLVRQIKFTCVCHTYSNTSEHERKSNPNRKPNSLIGRARLVDESDAKHPYIVGFDDIFDEVVRRSAQLGPPLGSGTAAGCCIKVDIVSA